MQVRQKTIRGDSASVTAGTYPSQSKQREVGRSIDNKTIIRSRNKDITAGIPIDRIVVEGRRFYMEQADSRSDV